MGDRERGVGQLGEGLCQECVATPGRPDEQDVRLLQLDVAGHLAMGDALVVVVDRYGPDTLGVVLADHILVQACPDGLVFRDEPTLVPLLRGGLVFFPQAPAPEGGAPRSYLGPTVLARLSHVCWD